MIFTENTSTFQKLADLLDVMYLAFDDKGYDLAEMEAIHITRDHTGAGDMTLIFDIHTMPTYTLPFKKDGNVAAILNSAE